MKKRSGPPEAPLRTLPKLSFDDDKPASVGPRARRTVNTIPAGPASTPDTERSPLAPSGPRLLPSLIDEDGTTTDRTELIKDGSLRKGDRPTLTILAGTGAGRVITLRNEITIGREKGVDVLIRDVGVSRRHARIFSVRRGPTIEDLGSTNGVRLNGTLIDRAKLQPGDRIQLGPEVVLQFAYLDDAEENLTKRLYLAATRDPLTQALNRRAFDERLVAECSYAARHGTALALVLFDVDHFKRVNDVHGHQIGDRVLSEVASVARVTIRDEDAFGRYGGEEFVLIVRGEGVRQATVLAERIRRAAANVEVRSNGSPVRVTLSAGIAEIAECEPAEPAVLLGLADKRLYRAKADGRDRVCAQAGE